MQENGGGSPGRASKQQASVSLSTNAPATGTVVKMGRREGWARFLAYEVRNLPDDCSSGSSVPASRALLFQTSAATPNHNNSWACTLCPSL